MEIFINLFNVGERMNFNGTVYRGALKGREVDNLSIEDNENGWVVSFNQRKMPIAWMIMDGGAIVPFELSLFQVGAVIFCWEYPKANLIRINKILD